MSALGRRAYAAYTPRVMNDTSFVRFVADFYNLLCNKSTTDRTNAVWTQITAGLYV